MFNSEKTRSVPQTNIAIKKGDCLELMRDIPSGSVDMVLVDPPYGINYQSQRKKDKSQWKPKIKGDQKPFVEFLPEMKRVLSPRGCALIFSRWDVQQITIDAMDSLGIKPRGVIIWDKVSHGMGDLKRAPGSRYESILFYSEKDFRFPGKRPTDIVRFSRIPANQLIHPNEKPQALLEHLISTYTSEGATVLDNCMGVGSTGIACLSTGRSFIGIELDDSYYLVAKDRLRNALETGDKKTRLVMD